MTLHLVQGDITQFTGDAIVNAANASLMGGGGVDGAIHRAAGRELLEECRTLGGCEVGNAKITKGYNLPARYVIHAVGPVWWGGQRGEAALLASAYRRSLELAEAHGITHIAFPAISCGAYNYPIDLATPIAVATVQAFLAHHPLPREVTFYAFDEVVYRAYQKALAPIED